MSPGKRITKPATGERAGTQPLGCGVLAVPAAETSIWLAWREHGLSHLFWTPLDAPRPSAIDSHVPELPIPAQYAEPLQRYFAGEPVDPVELPVELSGTPFQLKVWDALRRIPRGAVRSYAGIAADIGNPRAMRAVGMANGANPVAIVVPCHRVVEKDFGIGGYSSGLPRKRFLLQLEGVAIDTEHVQPGQLSLI